MQRGSGMRLSHSTVAGLLDNCAYRVGLKSIVKLPDPPNGRLASGIAYHAAVEAHELARKQWYQTRAKLGDSEGLPFPRLCVVAADAVTKQPVDWGTDDLSQDEAVDQAYMALRHWYHTPIPEGQPGAGGSLRDRVMKWRPMSLEAGWNLWLPPFTSLQVVGFIDAVYLDEQADELIVVDQKTAARFGKWRLDGEGVRDQAATYVLAAMKAPGLPGTRTLIPRFEYHITRISEGNDKRFQGARVVAIDVDEVDLSYIEDRVAQAHQQQLRGEWNKNPGSWLCSEKWCPFWGKECDPHGPNEIDIEAYRE